MASAQRAPGGTTQVPYHRMYSSRVKMKGATVVWEWGVRKFTSPPSVVFLSQLRIYGLGPEFW